MVGRFISEYLKYRTYGGYYVCDCQTYWIGNVFCISIRKQRLSGTLFELIEETKPLPCSLNHDNLSELMENYFGLVGVRIGSYWSKYTFHRHMDYLKHRMKNGKIRNTYPNIR
jgi:hypothetical protein